MSRTTVGDWQDREEREAQGELENAEDALYRSRGFARKSAFAAAVGDACGLLAKAARELISQIEEKEEAMNDMEKQKHAEIEAAIRAARFVKIAPPPGTRAYDAREGGWRILVITGAWGYDGTAARELPLEPKEAILPNPPAPKMEVLQLPTELARLAVEIAEKQVFS